MNRKLVIILVALSIWALLALTYTRPWPSPDTFISALAIIVVWLSLWAAVFAPIIYFIGAPFYHPDRQKA